MKKAVPHRVIVNVGLRVVELRHSKSLTQEHLSELVGISPRQLQRIEAGSSELTITMLVEIANALGVDAAELFVIPSHRTERRPGRPTSRRTRTR